MCITLLRLRGLVGAERGSRLSQGIRNVHCGRMRLSKHAPRDPFRVLERRHCLVKIVERDGGVNIKRPRVRRGT